MKSHLFLCWAAAAALALCAACSEDAELDNDTLAKPQPLVFVATQDGLTAESRAAADGTWAGDGTELVAIKIGTEVKKYKVTDTGGTLEPYDDNNIFYRTDKSGIGITAWYPYSDSEPTAPDISEDQSTNQESSNLMKATATATYGKSTTLAFSHQTARLRFHLYKEGSTTEDLTGATVKVTVTNGSAQTEYTAHEDGEGWYSVLVAPNATVSSGADFLSITAGSVGPYKATAPAYVTFLAGRSYEYDFNLGRIPYVTFSAASEQGFKMTLPTNIVTNFGTFEYSVGDGEWTTVTSGTEVTFGGTNGNLRLRGKSSVGTAAVVTTSFPNGNSYSSISKSTISFTNDVSVAASGDIRTLVDYENYSTASTASARFTNLFKGCTVLTSAPDLPATTLVEQCYSGMFSGCTKLETAPAELPATELAEKCYYQMFYNCKALETAPDLSATTLAEQCCYMMFSGCTALTTAPTTLPAETLAEQCYYQMFSSCTTLKTAPTKLPATTLAEECYYQMFYRCTSLTTAPAELPATELAEKCYYGMFQSCTNLTTAPKIKAETLASYSCYQMFRDCTSLTTVHDLPAKELKSHCYDGMFYGCKVLATAPKIEATTLAERCCYQMFYQCTALTTVPDISATTLAPYCCYQMFQYCTDLETAPALPATELAESCYLRMFDGCSSLTKAPELNATTLAKSCYQMMFNGCTSLKTAPKLEATNLVANCYQQMFLGCTSLTEAPVLPATTLANYCYSYMFQNCTKLEKVTIEAESIASNALYKWLDNVASSGTIKKKSSLALEQNSGSGIPSGWTVETITE